jgi:hypothetical protein
LIDYPTQQHQKCYQSEKLAEFMNFHDEPL